MRALVLVGFNRLEVHDLPAPVAGPGEVVVETAFTGICGSDLHGFTGANGRRVPGQVMGHETSGRVLAVGAGVTGFAAGEPVTVNPVVVPGADAAAWRGREHQHPDKWVLGVRPDVPAAFAQQFVVPAGNVLRLPAGMALDHAALVEPVAVGTHAVGRLGGVPPAVLVTGGGPIGQSVVMALRAAGAARVVVSEPEPGRRQLLEALGAVAVDPRAGEVAAQVAAILGGPADAAVDAVGSSGSLADCLAATRPGAVVCLVGMASPTVELPAFAVSTGERTLVGSFAYSSADFAAALAGVAAAPGAAAALVSRTVPLADAPAAFTALAAGDGTPGKVLVDLAG